MIRWSQIHQVLRDFIDRTKRSKIVAAFHRPCDLKRYREKNGELIMEVYERVWSLMHVFHHFLCYFIPLVYPINDILLKMDASP